jgi:membrane protein DedA with SNARE-associated domain
MSPTASTILNDYGPVAVALWVAIGCAAVPVPVWPLLILAGALAEAGTIAGAPMLAAALAGAMAGDAAGYALGRGGGRLRARLAAQPRIAPVLAAAEARLAANAVAAVFFTRWLVAPLGPYVNIAAGIARIAVWRVLPPALAGRMLWVGGYLALGWAFGDAVDAVGATVGEIARGILLLAVVMTVLWFLRASWRVRRRRAAAAGEARQAARDSEAARAPGRAGR